MFTFTCLYIFIILIPQNLLDSETYYWRSFFKFFIINIFSWPQYNTFKIIIIWREYFQMQGRINLKKKQQQSIKHNVCIMQFKIKSNFRVYFLKIEYLLHLLNNLVEVATAKAKQDIPSLYTFRFKIKNSMFSTESRKKNKLLYSSQFNKSVFKRNCLVWVIMMELMWYNVLMKLSWFIIGVLGILSWPAPKYLTILFN